MGLKSDLKDKKPFLGREISLKRIKKGEAKKVYLSSNCFNKEEIIKNCKINNIEYEELKETSKEVGILCKKPFNVSVVSF